MKLAVLCTAPDCLMIMMKDLQVLCELETISCDITLIGDHWIREPVKFQRDSAGYK